MSLALVICDCDGVLVDSEWISIGLEVRLLAEVGWHLSVEEVVGRFVGRGHRSIRHRLEITGLLDRFERGIHSAEDVSRRLAERDGS